MNKTNIILDHRTCKNIVDKNLSDNAIISYFALKSLYNPNMEIMYIPIQSIIYQLNPEVISMKKEQHRKLFQSYIDGILELEKHGYIEIIEINKDSYLIDLSNLYTESSKDELDEFGSKINTDEQMSYYSVYDLETIRMIIINNCKRKGILRFLLYYLGCKYENDEYYYFNKDKELMESETGIDGRTIDRYLEILEGCEIICAYRYEYKWSDSKKQLGNVYGLYESKEIIEDLCLKFIKTNMDKIYKSSTGKKKVEINKSVKSESDEFDWFLEDKEEIVNEPIYMKDIKESITENQTNDLKENNYQYEWQSRLIPLIEEESQSDEFPWE